MQNKKYSIYKLTSPNNKVYIGVTSNIEKRFQCYSRNYCKLQPLIYKSLLKYKWENFNKEILFSNLTRDNAFIKENELVKEYKKLGNSLNIISGGTINAKFRSLPVIIYNINTKENLGEFKNCSEAAKNFNESVFGFLHSVKLKTYHHKEFIIIPKELNQKEILNNIKIFWRRYKIVQLTREFEYINTFNSAREASRFISGGSNNASVITECLRGEKNTYANYLWIYEKDYKNGKLPNYKDPKNYHNSIRCKIQQLDLNGEFIKEFRSIIEAVNETKTSRHAIMSYLKGKVKNPYKYRWKRV